MTAAAGCAYRLPRRRLLQLAAAATTAGLARLTPPTRAWAQAEESLPGIVRETLPNGLLVLVEERRRADTLALQLTSRAGSRDDGHQPGISTITSRMLMQGTSRRPSETALKRTAAGVGGALGRAADVELCWLSSVVPSREADVAFDLLADIVAEPLLDESTLERQKQIALQDLARRRSTPSELLADLFQEAMFAGHPLSSPILGSEESIGAFNAETVSAHREAFWNASHLILTVVGSIRPEEALARAHQYFGGLPAGCPNERPALEAPPPEATRTVRGETGGRQAQFRLGFAVPGLSSEERFPLLVLNALMGGTPGRLFRALRTERGLTYVASSAYISFSDAGAWYATAGVDPANLEEALEVARAEIQRLRDEPPGPEELAARIGQLAGREVLADETNAARARRLALREALGTEHTEEYVERIRAVTADDVQRVAEAYLDPERALLAVVGPTPA